MRDPVCAVCGHVKRRRTDSTIQGIHVLHNRAVLRRCGQAFRRTGRRRRHFNGLGTVRCNFRVERFNIGGSQCGRIYRHVIEKHLAGFLVVVHSYLSRSPIAGIGNLSCLVKVCTCLQHAIHPEFSLPVTADKCKLMPFSVRNVYLVINQFNIFLGVSYENLRHSFRSQLHGKPALTAVIIVQDIARTLEKFRESYPQDNRKVSSIGNHSGGIQELKT